jgi:hypothetical protein
MRLRSCTPHCSPSLPSCTLTHTLVGCPRTAAKPPYLPPTFQALLAELAPLTSPDFHAALSDALAAVEAGQGGAPVLLDGASTGYKAFAAKVRLSVCYSCAVEGGEQRQLVHVRQ